MTAIFARRAFLPDGWHADTRLTLGGTQIETIQPGATQGPDDIAVDALLPALSNLHSHSFQRAMAGLTEYRAQNRDSFWTWRDLMYRFVEHLSPEQLEVIAAQTFLEMQEAGYAAVGEFHYVHHQADGTPYDQTSELSDRILAAARQTGIGLTHLPVLYTYGGAGRAPISGGQRRFGHTPDSYARLIDAVADRLAAMPADTRLGIAPHSLRATCPDDLAAVLPLGQGRPIHIHVAEQPREVAEIESWLGARPVDWLLDSAPVGPDWCLIHATHMTADETTKLAQSGAVAGLCPITEANLGDGAFDGPGFLAARGMFGIGSDSNVRISLTEELRMLEYSQRLRDGARNVLASNDKSTGTTLYLGAAEGGAKALGRNAGRLAPGALADLVAIDRSAPALCALPDDRLLDGLCFAATDRVVTDLWSAGRHRVKDGRHIHRDTITAAFRSTLQDVMQAIA